MLHPIARFGTVIVGCSPSSTLTIEYNTGSFPLFLNVFREDYLFWSLLYGALRDTKLSWGNTRPHLPSTPFEKLPLPFEASRNTIENNTFGQVAKLF